MKTEISEVMLMTQRQRRHLSLARMIPRTYLTFLNGPRFYTCNNCAFVGGSLAIFYKNSICLNLQENKNGSLQIICEYYQLHYPARGCSVKFHPLEHLHPLEYYRSGKTVLHVAGSTIDPRSCSTSLELAEVIIF